MEKVVPLAYRIAKDKNNIPDFAWLLTSVTPTVADIEWAKEQIKRLKQ